MTPAERAELARQAAARAQVPSSWAGDKRLSVELAAAGLTDGVPPELDGAARCQSWGKLKSWHEGNARCQAPAGHDGPHRWGHRTWADAEAQHGEWS